MKSSEVKNLKTKLKLYEEVHSAESSILYNIQNEAGMALKKVIEPKMFFKDGQETVELTAEEFTQIRLVLARISLNDGLKELGHGLVERYLNEKSEKLRIIGMLS